MIWSHLLLAWAAAQPIDLARFPSRESAAVIYEDYNRACKECWAAHEATFDPEERQKLLDARHKMQERMMPWHLLAEAKNRTLSPSTRKWYADQLAQNLYDPSVGWKNFYLGNMP